MDYIQFENKEVAEAFESRFTANVTMRVPGIWTGKISKITPAAADALFAQGHKHILKKPATQRPAPLPSASKTPVPNP